jgi:solute carrier family 35, member F1/2
MQVVGQMGLWGSIINGVQAASLEHRQIRDAPWTGAVVGLLIAYTAGKSNFNVLLQAGRQKDDICKCTAMVTLYTVAPMLYRLASSAYFNLSLLSSDFFGLLFGMVSMTYCSTVTD